ncbi:acetyl-CoA carboxylase biotin carboxyl carrier protein, partial [bacterium]|nr:acetyl-CoA carboxylase biotin carboxyl carrier protein [bacterium]
KEVEAPLLEEEYERIVCPLSGTFYRSSSPETEFFVEVGDNVRCGDTLALVEAMKMFNEIKSEVQGQIVEILALNAEVVEEGRLLFLIKVEDSHLAAD